MKNSDRYKFRIFLKTKLISVSIFEFYTERYIVVYTGSDTGNHTGSNTGSETIVRNWKFDIPYFYLV